MLTPMNRMRVLVLIILLSSTAPVCFGIDGVCPLLSTSALVGEIGALRPSDRNDPSHRDASLHAGRAAERLLYIIGRCPEQFVAALPGLRPKDWVLDWKGALHGDPTLQPEERSILFAAARSAIGNRSKEAETASQMLRGLDAAMPKPMNQPCGPLFRHLLIGLLDDWMARSGAEWFAYSDSMLFMLASCPEDFYYVLDQRPEVLSSWLSELPTASFWGEPSARGRLESLQRSLERLLLTDEPPEYLRSTRDGIVTRISTLCVTVVDGTSPCEKADQ